MKTEIINLLITIPLEDELIKQIQQVSPLLKINQHVTRNIDEISAFEWSQTDILYTNTVIPEPEKAPKLRWVQSHWAGVEFALDLPLLKNPNVQFTTLSGAAAPQMAEYVLASFLMLSHKFPDMLEHQKKSEWPKDKWERFLPAELRGSTVGIVGYGSIGREVARLLQPFDVKILATKHNLMDTADTGYTPEGLGDPDGSLFTRLYPIEAIKSMVKLCDFVVVCLPLTEKTHNLIGADVFDAMKNTAYLVDVGRGGIIQEKALVEALQERKIKAAVLDVFTTEPLPANSPLWKLSNVVITPHISGSSSKYNERATALFVENLKRYLDELPLYNRVNLENGY